VLRALSKIAGLAIGAIAAVLSAAMPGRAASTAQDDRALYTKDELAVIFQHSPLGALPPGPTDGVANDPRAVALGQFLYFDARLSANGKVSCASCHQPAHGFTDGLALARGLSIGSRNTPTVLNAVYGHWFFWDGRTDSLWSQALQPFENPREFGSDRLHIVHAVADDPALRDAYEQVFRALPSLEDGARFPAHARPDPDPQARVAKAWAGMAPADRTAVDRAFSNLGKAIEAYERKLVSGDSPFDRYVAALKAHDPAQEQVVSPAAKRGLKLFIGPANCELCHAGPTFSDGQFHNLGLPPLLGEAADLGRADGIRLVKADPFNGIGAFSDDPHGTAKERIEFLPKPETQLGAFKTPTLRNVALTAPYMHDGRFATLEQVMTFYAEGKAASQGRLVGKREATADLVPHLTKPQQEDLIAFLKTLTGTPLSRTLTEPPSRP
jgi:cytochrome c peroxidase